MSDMGLAIDIVTLPRNLGIVVLCIAGFYWLACFICYRAVN